jgi:predicted site-specific integrase-resolvase
MIREQIDIHKACADFAESRIKLTDVLGAGDLLRINDALKYAQKGLLLEGGASYSENLIPSVWSILHELYGPKRQYILLLETAIACNRFLSLPDLSSFSMQTLSILFGTVYQDKTIFSGLVRQWTLSTNPRGELSSMDIELALVHILKVFQEMWTHTVTLIRVINQKREEIHRLISERFPAYSHIGMGQFLSARLFVRNQDLSSELQLSAKTAIKYLKALEQQNILHSVKNGREIYYFNNCFLDMIRKQILEVASLARKSRKYLQNKADISAPVAVRKAFIAGVYVRVSSTGQEGNSIDNQRRIAESYIESQTDIELYKVYIDDGISSFAAIRPSFSDLLLDIEAKLINCVVVKDISRFSRNYIEAGNFLERQFPSREIRFISVNDHFDICMETQRS